MGFPGLDPNLHLALCLRLNWIGREWTTEFCSNGTNCSLKGQMSQGCNLNLFEIVFYWPDCSYWTEGKGLGASQSYRSDKK